MAHAATPTPLQAYADLYGEEVTEDAVADLGKYFSYRAVLGLTVGGLPTGLPPLAILPREVRPSTTAISVIGEGLVGWYMQARGLRPLSRPIGEGPDFVFEDTTTIPTLTALVEAKSTQQSDVRQQMRDATIPRLEYALKVATSGARVSCFITGVVIKSTSDFDVLNLDIELT